MRKPFVVFALAALGLASHVLTAPTAVGG